MLEISDLTPNSARRIVTRPVIGSEDIWGDRLADKKKQRLAACISVRVRNKEKRAQRRGEFPWRCVKIPWAVARFSRERTESYEKLIGHDISRLGESVEGKQDTRRSSIKKRGKRVAGAGALI